LNYFFTARFAQDAEIAEVLFLFAAERAANKNHSALRAHCSEAAERFPFACLSTAKGKLSIYALSAFLR
jgi:hypothetical protein